MDIVGKARRLEAGIARVFDGAARTVAQSGALQPLEIAHAIVEHVASQAQAAGRGRHVFPFNLIKVVVVAPSKEARARIAVVFDSEPSLRVRIAARLRVAGCDEPGPVVRLTYVSTAMEHWTDPQWHVEFANVTPVSPAEIASPVDVGALQRAIELTIVKGSGEPASSLFTQLRIELGRCVEVVDARGRLLRTNHLAFADEASPINQSVSRRHAHIDFTEGDYRLHDDRSAHGTGVLRGGRAIAVPSGSRGIRLRSGDEILLGEARVRVTIS